MRRDFRVLVDDVLGCYIRGGFHHTVTNPTLKNLMAAPEDEFRRRDVKNTHTQRQHGIRFVLFFRTRVGRNMFLNIHKTDGCVAYTTISQP